MTTEEQWSDSLRRVRQAIDAGELATAEQVLLDVYAKGLDDGTQRALLILRSREMHDAADAVAQIDA